MVMTSEKISNLIQAANISPHDTKLGRKAVQMFHTADRQRNHLSKSEYINLFRITQPELWNDDDPPLVNIITLSHEPLALLMMEHMMLAVFGI
jgi:hypothetical protein